MPAWPADVPFLCSLKDLDRSGPLGRVSEFVPDVGVPKTRRRTTAAYRRIAGATDVMDATQYADFLDFWESTLAGGVLDFTATHPVTGATVTFRPTGDGYGETLVAAGKVRISLVLYEIPT